MPHTHRTHTNLKPQSQLRTRERTAPAEQRTHTHKHTHTHTWPNPLPTHPPVSTHPSTHRRTHPTQTLKLQVNVAVMFDIFQFCTRHHRSTGLTVDVELVVPVGVDLPQDGGEDGFREGFPQGAERLHEVLGLQQRRGVSRGVRDT